MKNTSKPARKVRFNLYIDESLSEWIIAEARKMGINATAFARLLILRAAGKNG